MSSIRALLPPLLLLCTLYVALAASDDAHDFTLLILPSSCVRQHMGVDGVSLSGLLRMARDLGCMKRVISKVLGYGIIAGACIVKIPQIIRFLSKGSVAGVSYTATYLDLIGYIAQCVYHITLGSPWSAYGEAVIITVQSIGIVLLMWGYQWPGTLHVVAVSLLLAATAQASLMMPSDSLQYLQWATTALFVSSRAWQIVANAQQGSTGELSFLTLFMNFAGSAARIFTSSQEVKRVEVMASFIISSALNFTLVAQYVYYGMTASSKAEGATLRAAAPAKSRGTKTD